MQDDFDRFTCTPLSFDGIYQLFEGKFRLGRRADVTRGALHLLFGLLKDPLDASYAETEPI